MRFSRRQVGICIFDVLLCVFGLAASTVHAQLLNSERIEQQFGSYGLDVLYSEPRLRVSNLYSLDQGHKITRTLAIVGYPVMVDDALAEEHAAILAGSSIGATFQAAGWQVVKTAHDFFPTPLPAAAAVGMRTVAAELATHAYRLTLIKDGRRFDYASIIEIHDPAYLTLADLEAIYGPDEHTGTPDEVTELLVRGIQALARAGSTLGQ